MEILLPGRRPALLLLLVSKFLGNVHSSKDVHMAMVASDEMEVTSEAHKDRWLVACHTYQTGFLEVTTNLLLRIKEEKGSSKYITTE